jgi:hypothetical protein
LGCEVVVSDGQTDGQVTLVDARGLGVAMEGIELRSATHASVQMAASVTGDAVAPTAMGTPMVSLFQTNSRALRAEREFAVRVIRPSSVASMTGVSWGVAGGSPLTY